MFDKPKRFIILLTLLGLLLQAAVPVQAGVPQQRDQALSIQQPEGVDLRQAGEIFISGDLVETGKVYLTIPVRNYGSTASPPIHPYTEGYTSQGSLWRADGSQPTAVVIQPGQTVSFTVQHDLWEGHLGLWYTYGVFLWDDSNGTYYGPLSANGYNQQVAFTVTLNIRQVGPIVVSGNLVEGGIVYLTFPIQNFSSVTSPALHPYTEGYTAQGALWRADGANPTAQELDPGEIVEFTVQHDLWVGHAGQWTVEEVYLWNDSDGTYYGPLVANGYDQQIEFTVQSGPDLRQSGAIQVSGTLVQGEKVYLDIPVTNYGGTPTGALHVYTEGYTSNGSLWRADGANPTARIIQPGETVTFRVEHDLWYGHVGTWRTYGVYIWDDDNGTYYGPLAANGYSQEANFTLA